MGKFKKNVNTSDNKQLSIPEINRLAALVAKFETAKRDLDEFGKFLLEQHGCSDGKFVVQNGRLVRDDAPQKA